MTSIADIATAIAAMLTTGKDAGWFAGFPTIAVVERRWEAVLEIADVEALRISVVPMSQEREKITRVMDIVDPVVGIAISAHLPTGTDITSLAAIDPYVNLGLRVAEIIAGGVLPSPAADAKLMSLSHIVLDQERLVQGRCFFSTITSTWRVAQAARVSMPPAPLVAPVITGTPEDGSTLTCSTGTWSYAPTAYVYGWYVDGVLVPSLGAVGTLLLTGALVGHSVSCRVTASNPGGSGLSAFSNAMTVLEYPT